MKRQILLGAMFIVGCATLHPSGSADAALRSALDVMTVSIGAISDTTHEACVQLGQLEVSKARAGLQSADESETKLVQIEGRCTFLRAAFGHIREVQDQAASFVEKGQLAQAEQKLKDAQGLWTSLKEAGVSP